MSISLEISKVLDWVSDKWERRSTIAGVELALFLFLIWKYTDRNISDLSPWSLLFICGICALVYAFWLYNVAIPKCDKNHVGIALAIAAETKEEYRTIAQDFLSSLRRLLDAEGTTHKLSVIEIPQHHASKVHCHEDAISLRRKCRCHFLVWGTARLRKIEGRDMHILKLEGLVAHAGIPDVVANQFSQEFAELFPRSVKVDKENDVVNLEVTSDWLNLVARYIIATAAVLSGDIKYAEGLFLSIVNDQRLRECTIPAIRKIRQRTPVRLGEIYLFRGRLAYEEWRKTQSQAGLEAVGINLIALAKHDSANYAGRLLRAIYLFINARDINGAETELRKCRDIRDATWRYSWAFLLAYKGEMHRARRMYKTAFANYCSPHVPVDTEDFMALLLKQEPDKTQLYFCLGLVNWHGKEDFQQAIKDFKTFLGAKEANNFPEEVKLAQAYIITLEDKLRRRNANETSS